MDYDADIQSELESLMKAANASFGALAMAARSQDGGVVLAGIDTVGDERACAHWQSFIGVERDPGWDPTKSSGEEQKFEKSLQNIEAREGTLPAVYDFAYQPVGLRYDIRILLYEGRTFVGWLGVARFKDEEPFTNDDVNVLNKRKDLVTARLASLVEARRALVPREFAICMDDSDVVSASDAGWRLADDDRVRGILLPQVSRFRASGLATGEAYVVGRKLNLWRVVDDAGQERVFVSSADMGEHKSSPFAGTTPRQEEICRLLLCGLTAKEIAADLDIGFHTVRQHIKDAYEVLGVASKAELFQLAANEE